LSNQKQDRATAWVVKVRYVATPDAKERLSRTVAILLKSGMEKNKKVIMSRGYEGDTKNGL